MSTLIDAMVRHYETLMARLEKFEGPKELDSHVWVNRAGNALFSGAEDLVAAIAAVEPKTADDAVAQLAALAETIRDTTDNEHDEFSLRMLRRRMDRLLYALQGYIVAQGATIDVPAVQCFMPAYANPWRTPDELAAAHEKPHTWERKS